MRSAGLAAAATALVIAVPVASGAETAGPKRAVQTRLDLASSPEQYVPGEVIVRFRAGVARGAAARAHARAGGRVTMRFRAFRMHLAKLPRGLSVREAVRAYEDDPAVEFAEPNYLRYPDAVPPPGDALFGDLWGLDNTAQSHSVSNGGVRTGTAGADVDVLNAWDVQAGNGTVVAVIDSGVDVSHPDLSGRLWTNPGEVPGNFVDDDGNGKKDDVHGWDFGNSELGDNTLLDTAPFFPGYDHGTHVAGTIAAALDGSTGVVGVCPGCRIMVLKIAHDVTGAMPVSKGIAALAYARREGAKIVNLSLGGPMWSNAEREAFRISGMLAVVAAGNHSLDNDMALGVDDNNDGRGDRFSPSYPASYTLPNILAVGASNDRDENGYSSGCYAFFLSKARCAFTNWGHDSVDVSAPGVDVASTVPGGDWKTWDGTSMAAPHVAGVAGLVRSQNPGYTVAQIKNAVMRSVEKPTNLRTMYIRAPFGPTARPGAFTRTSGRINADRAFDVGTTNATPRTDGNVDGAAAMSRARVSGSVAWPADVNDVKKRKLFRGKKYRITLVVPRGRDYDLFIWKPGTKEIWQFPKLLRASFRSGAADEVITFKARATGVYYLHVGAWMFQSGGYTLKFARIG
ncbi:MAG TPA: S8 family peptidase [Gaiellaceae bacterium]|nr:S8 family peptidase [Gaiellaceae bacterium]